VLGNAALRGKSPGHFARVFTRIAHRELDAITPVSAPEFIADAEAINHEFGMTCGAATAAASRDERRTRWWRHWRTGSTLGESPLQRCNTGSQGRVFTDRGMQAHAEVAGQSDRHSNQHGRHGPLPFNLSDPRTRISTTTSAAGTAAA
jgi:hypothetical protein